MRDERLTRRELVRRTVFLSVVASVPAGLLSACGGGELECTDESALSSSERDARRAARYEDRSRDADRTCSQCSLYQAASAETCGSCTVVRGPINPHGSCSLFVARG